QGYCTARACHPAAGDQPKPGPAAPPKASGRTHTPLRHGRRATNLCRTTSSLQPQPGEMRMRRFLGSTVLACVAAAALVVPTWGQDAATYERQRDVIYGRKFGTALTMDVFTPKA